MLDHIGSLGADLLSAAIPVAIFCGSAFVGVKAAERFNKPLVGWMVALAVFAGAMVIFGPSMTMLRHKACAGSASYQDCINGGDSID